MTFWSLFKNNSSDIIARLSVVRGELNAAQDSIKNLIEGHTPDNPSGCAYDCLINAAVSQFGVAMWAKDKGGQFIFANKACCETILKCTQEEALGHSDGEFPENALAHACLRSEALVLENQKTMRFIECGLMPEGFAAIDTVKSPISHGGKIVGTIGTGCNITKLIAHKPICPLCIEIPMSAILTKGKITELLEDNL